MQVNRLNAYQQQNFGMIKVPRPAGMSRTALYVPICRAIREIEGCSVSSSRRDTVFHVMTKFGSPEEAKALAEIQVFSPKARSVENKLIADKLQ